MKNSPEQSGESQAEIVRKHVHMLSEWFDSVQIFASINLGDGQGTRTFAFGSGDVYSRSGQVRDWIIKHDERSRIEERSSETHG